MNTMIFPSLRRMNNDHMRTLALLRDKHGYEALTCTETKLGIRQIDAWHPQCTNWTLTVHYLKAARPGEWGRQITITWWAWDQPDARGCPTTEQRKLPLDVKLASILHLTGDDVTFERLWAACDGINTDHPAGGA